jgi:hypothetical protein
VVYDCLFGMMYEKRGRHKNRVILKPVSRQQRIRIRFRIRKNCGSEYELKQYSFGFGSTTLFSTAVISSMRIPCKKIKTKLACNFFTKIRSPRAGIAHLKHGNAASLTTVTRFESRRPPHNYKPQGEELQQRLRP